ncbi:MAG: hypothetical protein ABSF50_16965 [Burkholderiaceae bacterium]|jgi:hypothetical protein
MWFRARYLVKALVAIVALAVLGGAVMVLWNAVIPVAFADGRPIDYLHALGLFILSRILIGGFKGHHAWHARGRWEKWQAMTPEEREELRERIHAGRRGRHREWT